MAAHSSILAWKIPWTEDPGRLQSTGLKELDVTEQQRPSPLPGGKIKFIILPYSYDKNIKGLNLRSETLKKKIELEKDLQV